MARWAIKVSPIIQESVLIFAGYRTCQGLTESGLLGEELAGKVIEKFQIFFSTPEFLPKDCYWLKTLGDDNTRLQSHSDATTRFN